MTQAYRCRISPDGWHEIEIASAPEASALDLLAALAADLTDAGACVVPDLFFSLQDAADSPELPVAVQVAFQLISGGDSRHLARELRLLIEEEVVQLIRRGLLSIGPIEPVACLGLDSSRLCGLIDGLEREVSALVDSTTVSSHDQVLPFLRGIDMLRALQRVAGTSYAAPEAVAGAALLVDRSLDGLDDSGRVFASRFWNDPGALTGRHVPPIAVACLPQEERERIGPAVSWIRNQFVPWPAITARVDADAIDRLIPRVHALFGRDKIAGMLSQRRHVNRLAVALMRHRQGGLRFRADEDGLVDAHADLHYRSGLLIGEPGGLLTMSRLVLSALSPWATPSTSWVLEPLNEVMHAGEHRAILRPHRERLVSARRDDNQTRSSVAAFLATLDSGPAAQTIIQRPFVSNVPAIDFTENFIRVAVECAGLLLRAQLDVPFERVFAIADLLLSMQSSRPDFECGGLFNRAVTGNRVPSFSC